MIIQLGCMRGDLVDLSKGPYMWLTLCMKRTNDSPKFNQVNWSLLTNSSRNKHG